MSSLCSDKKYKEICALRYTPSLDPSQKYFHFLIDGIAKNNECDIQCMSELPISASTVNEFLFKRDCDFEESIKYNYLPFFNGKFLRYMTIYISSIMYIFIWILKNKSEKKYVICDPLRFMITNPVRWICQLFGVPVCAYVTDIPYMTTSVKIKQDFFRKVIINTFERIAFFDCKKYDKYIFITYQMNDLINVNKRPYLIIDGSVQFSEANKAIVTDDSSTSKKILLYAGGLYEKFGIDNLIMAVHCLTMQDIELHLYGNGTSVEQIKKLGKIDKRIQYKGIIPSDQVFEREREAYLLINPRPTDETFTQFSFPSKTLEYMSSGTAVISTKLQGIGEEYQDYMFWFDDCTVLGLKKGLEFILNKSENEIKVMGMKAQKFVFQSKSNLIQAKRIINFILQ